MNASTSAWKHGEEVNRSATKEEHLLHVLDLSSPAEPEVMEVSNNVRPIMQTERNENLLRIDFMGICGQRVHVQRSSNLRDWEHRQTMTLDGTAFELTDDPIWAARRFYRAVEDDPSP